jgi:threonine/homoserine/homoserine lactone efflux protein
MLVAVVSPFASAATAMVGLMMSVLVVVWAVVAVAAIGAVAVAAGLVAQLVVVGDRGLGGFEGLLVGAGTRRVRRRRVRPGVLARTRSMRSAR